MATLVKEVVNIGQIEDGELLVVAQSLQPLRFARVAAMMLGMEEVLVLVVGCPDRMHKSRRLTSRHSWALPENWIDMGANSRRPL
jgi:hypothetical protein